MIEHVMATQLHMEADRAHRLDEELRGCKETLDREKVMRQNADLTVQALPQKREKQEELHSKRGFNKHSNLSPV